MNVISEKTIKKLQDRAQNGIRTILVEGPADVNLYKRIYPDADIRHFGSCDKIAQAIKQYNKTLGKTTLVAGIIDKDLKTDEEIEALSRENIFVLNEGEIESIFLRQDVIETLFGEEIFQRFAAEVCSNASAKTDMQITDYAQALKTLKEVVSSKFNIRILLKEAGIKNRGNAQNIDLLCSMMDKEGAWDLVKDIFPDLDSNARDNGDKTSRTEKFHRELKDFKSNQDLKCRDENTSEDIQAEKEI